MIAASNPHAELTQVDACKSAVFLVGRIDKRGKRIVFVNEAVEAPFPGPWDVRAVYTVIE